MRSGYERGDPDRPTNSGKTVYGIEREALALVKSYGTDAWGENLARYVSAKRSFFSRETRRPPARGASRGGASVVVPPGKRVFLSPGKHGALTADVCNKLAAEFAPGGVLLYVGDTAHKFAHHDKASLKKLGISLDAHGKVPDVILHDVRNGRLFLVEAVTSHGPVNDKRKRELRHLFSRSKADLVYVTAFPDMKEAKKHLVDVSWGTAVWLADSPDHMIHFDGYGPLKLGG